MSEHLVRLCPVNLTQALRILQVILSGHPADIGE